MRVLEAVVTRARMARKVMVAALGVLGLLLALTTPGRAADPLKVGGLPVT